jgi:hypothetical protein
MQGQQRGGHHHFRTSLQFNTAILSEAHSIDKTDNNNNPALASTMFSSFSSPFTQLLLSFKVNLITQPLHPVLIALKKRLPYSMLNFTSHKSTLNKLKTWSLKGNLR